MIDIGLKLINKQFELKNQALLENMVYEFWGKK